MITSDAKLIEFDEFLLNGPGGVEDGENVDEVE